MQIQVMNYCRYCEHSEARQAWWPGKGPERLICWQRQVPVRPGDTCPAFSRAPGADDDLGEDE